MKLRTERDVIEALAGRTVTLGEIYAACADARVAERDGGLNPIAGHGSDQCYKRRVRSTLQTLRRNGQAERLGDATWLVSGTRERPQYVVFLVAGDHGHLELALADAADLLAELGEMADLVVADPPWAMSRHVAGDARWEHDQRAYRRNASMVVPGYVDVPADEYAEFTARWVTAAAGALRPGAYLAVITGPSAAARVQVAAEDAGLTFVNQVVARKPFALQTSRQFSHAHSVVTIMCAGPLSSRRRFFAVPADLPRARSGALYPLDFWPDMTKPAERPGQLRYDNTLPDLAVRRCLHALTPGPENGGDPWQSLVVDPFLGGGTTALVAHRERRRYLGGDRNLHSLRYVMARFAEAAEQPQLFVS